MDFDPNQPFTVEDTGFDPSKPFTVAEESSSTKAPVAVPDVPHVQTNMRVRGSLADVGADESRVDAEKTQALGDEILAAAKTNGDPNELANVLAGKYGVSPKNISWYIENFRNGKYRGPINFAAPQSGAPIDVAGQPKETPSGIAPAVEDLGTGFEEGVGKFYSKIGEFGGRFTDALTGEDSGATERAEQVSKDVEQAYADQSNNPQGYARSIGRFFGEAAPQLPLFEVAPFGATGGRVGSVIDNALQGAASGALMSGGNPDELNQGMLYGGLGGAALGSLAHGAADVLGDKAKAFSPKEPYEAPTENPRVSVQEHPEDIVETPEAPEGPIETLAQKTKRLRDQRTQDVIKRADEITSTMATDVDVNVIPSTRNLTKAQRAQLKADGVAVKDAQAWVGEDGRIHVIADNVHPDEVSGVIFHEVLGHTGLAMAFRDGLDDVLTRLYEGNWRLRKEADDFIEKNPDLYAGPQQIARAVEEALAMRSEAGRIDTTTWENIKNYIREVGRKIGLDLRYSDSEVKAILKQAHDAVINGGEQATPSGVRYSLKKYREETPHQAKFREAAMEDQKTPSMTHEEVLDEMENEGIRPSRVLRKQMRIDPTLGPKAVVAYRQTVDKVLSVQKKILEGTATGKEEADFAYNLAKAAELVAKVENYKSDIGRALNFLKLVADGKDKTLPKDILSDNLISKITDANGDIDRNALYRLAGTLDRAQAIGPKAVGKVMSDMVKPLPEDYITSLHYSFMLSGLGTHAKNAIGNASLLFMDNLAYSAVAPKEGLARWWGTLKAFKDAQTYRDVALSWQEARPHHQVNKAEIGTILPGFLSYPQRALAASDSFFRSLIQSADYNGLAIRKAMEEGLTGAKMWDRVDELVQNPTDDIIGHATKKAERLQLVNSPGGLGKLMEVIKARPREDTEIGKRVTRFALQNVLPFTRVATNAYAMAVNWSPLGLLTKAGLESARAGGVEARAQFARMAMGTAILGYFTSLYVNDQLRVDPVSKQPEVKTKNGWMSLQGLDAVSIHAGTVAQIGETSKKFSEAQGLNKLGVALNGILSSMASQTFGDQIAQLWAATTPDAQGESAANRVIVNQVAGWSPAGLRQVANITDDYQRDTSGNGSLEDKIVGRLQSGIPGAREELPIRHNRLGDPVETDQTVLGVFNTKPADSAVEQEIQRLEKVKGTPLLSPVLPNQLKKYQPTPNSSVTQEFQEKSGQATKELLSEWIQAPEWKTMTDEQKIAVVKKISKAMRKQTREEMFDATR